jgi:hypothetical protein
LHNNRKGSIVEVKSGPERGVSLSHSSSIFEGRRKCAVSLNYSLRIVVHGPYVLHKVIAKPKSFKYVEDIGMFHAVICGGLVEERHDCERQIVHVGNVYGVSDEVQVVMNGFVRYTVALICGDR